jgi:hypothetical protein
MTFHYQGDTLDFIESFVDDFGEPLAVDSAVFVLQSPLLVQTTIAATLAADRMSATAHYDLADDCEDGVWTWCCVTGGALHKTYREHKIEVLPRSIASVTPPATGYWHRVYHGAGVASITTPATLMALGHTDIGDTVEWSFDQECEAQALYVCVPTGWDIEVRINGVLVPWKTIATATLTEYDGTSATYDVRESVSANYDSQDTTVEVVVTEAP